MSRSNVNFTSHKEDILILAKTYPSPSKKYTETSCIAGINKSGEMRRVYPVPFRFLEESRQFAKWQWIEAIVNKSQNDHRKESFTISVDTIKIKQKVPSKQQWKARKVWIDRIPLLHLHEDGSISNEETLLRAKPTTVPKLVIKECSHEWSQEQQQKLDMSQQKLFPEERTRQEDIKKLRKVPIDVFLEYSLCTNCNKKISMKHKLVDWEFSALYWNCQKKGQAQWQDRYCKKVEEVMNKDVTLLLGNIHRFQNQWLIVSVFYPPRMKDTQPDLFA